MRKLLVLVLSMIMAVSLAVPVSAASSVVSAQVSLYLDGQSALSATEVPPEIRSGRTMIPIRALAEKLGADVGWEQATRKVTLTRAGVTIVMTVGSRIAYVDGKAVEMDVAPYITGGRTLIPARYVAEFFGQKVEWDGEKRRVDVTEDKSAAGDSNLEAWALPMGAMLSNLNQGDAGCFGLYGRAKWVIDPRTANSWLAEMTYPYDRCRYTLSSSWDINSREELIFTVCTMTVYGHNASFLMKAAGQDTDDYTRKLGAKWGERGILCWDLFRMSNLVQWGYVAGYVTYEEALALLEPAATLLQENFTSWDEAYENYLDGYAWWSGDDGSEDVWQTQRGKAYQTMKENAALSAVFDDTLFQTDIVPVPGITAQQLLAETLEG